MRRALASLVILAALALGSSTTFAARPPAPSFNVAYFDRQNPVEQQTCTPDRSICGATTPPEYWIVNPTACLWDGDDQMAAEAYGRLERGASVSFTLCIVGDWSPHLVWIDASPGIVTSIAASGGPTTDHCLWGPDYDHEYTGFAPIEGSNGGVGVVHVLTFTATNVASKPLTHAGIRVGSVLDTTQALDFHCPGRMRLPDNDPVWWVG